MKRFLLYIIFLVTPLILNGQQYLSSNHIWGSGSAEVDAFIADDLQNTYISGYFNTQLIHNDDDITSAGSYDIFLTKYNDDQEEEWFVRIGSSGNDQGTRMGIAPDGNLIISGSYSNGTAGCVFGTTLGQPVTLSTPAGNGLDIFLAKYNSQTGELLWAKSIVAGVGAQLVTSLLVDSDGSILVGGGTAGAATFSSNPSIGLPAGAGFLVKFSSIGDYQWHTTLSSSASDPVFVYGITAQTGRYAFTGYTKGLTTFNDSQGETYNIGPNVPSTNANSYTYIGAVDINGHYKWLKNCTGSLANIGSLMTTDNSNTLYLTGYYSSADFSYDGIPLNLPNSTNKQSIYLFTLDGTNGNLNHAYSNGSTGTDYPYGLQVKNNLLYISGSIGAKVNLPDGRELPSGMFVAAYTINASNTLNNIDVLEGVKADNAKGIVFSPKSFKLAGSFSGADKTPLVIGDDEYINTTPSTKDVYMAKACPIIGINATVNNVTGCLMENKGSIMTDVVGGANPYTYVWANEQGIIPGQTGPSISGLDTGKYTVLVIYNEGQCSKSRDFTITAPDAIYIKSATVGEANCTVADSKGSITVNAVFPAGKTVEYRAELIDFGLGASYDSDWVSGNMFNNCPPGEYRISARFTDNHACTATANVGVSRVGSEVLQVEGPVISYTCNIINDPAKVGQVTVKASATQDWFGLVDAATGATVQQVILTAPEDTHTFAELLPGSYKAKSGHLTANDPIDCILISEPINITQPKAVVITSVKPIDVQCAGSSTGGITVKATGDPGLIYELYNSTTPDVVVSDNSDGKFTGLDGGTYNVTVWNAGKTCSSSVNNITVSDLNVELTLSLVSQHDACAANVQSNPKGSVRLSASGGGSGTTTYTYTLTGTLGTDPYPSASGNFSKNVPADTYTATVMEQYTKCKTTLGASIVIGALPEVKFKDTQDHGIVPTAALCYGGNDGKIAVSGMTGGTETSYVVTAAFTSGGTEIGKATQAPYEITGLYANDAANPFYYIKLTDDYGCAASSTPQTVVSQPTQVTVTIDNAVSDTHIECYGGNGGILKAVGDGGTTTTTQKYTFDLYKSGVKLATNQDGMFGSLVAGVYIIRVFDDNSCEAETSPITITQAAPIKVTLAKVNVKCFGAKTGSIEVTGVTNGSSPYSYVLRNSEDEIIPSASDASLFPNLAADTYKLTVKDLYQCSKDSADIVITQPATPVSIVSAVQTKLVSCDPGADGAITVEANGGTGAYTYSSNGASFSGDHILGSLAANTDAGYTVTVKDANACLATANVKVRATVNPNLSASVVTDAKCYNDKGAIAINATPDNLEGSSLNAMSSYWIEGVDGTQYSTTPSSDTNYPGLNGGNYKLSAQDTYGCIGAKTVTLGEPASAMGLSVTSYTDLFGSTKGSITVQPSGGWLEYTITCYFPSNSTTVVGAPQTGDNTKTYTFANLTGIGEYKIEAVDVKGCKIHQLQILKMATGELDLDAPSLKIFPNPSSDGRFIIEWDTKEDRKVTLEVYTTSGKLVYKTNVQTGMGGVRTSLDISGQSRGTYLLRVPELDIKQKLVAQ